MFNNGRKESYMALELNNNSFVEEVLKSDLPVLVDFWGPNCAPCEQLAPIINTLAEKTSGIAKVCKLNVHDAPETAAQYGIRGVPTVIVFEGGKEKQRFIGVQHPAKYLDALGLEMA